MTELDKAITIRVKRFRNLELKNPQLKMNFQMTKLGAKDYLKNYRTNQLKGNLAMAIVGCADYNFGLWHQMAPNKNYDISIYLLCVVGASETVSEFLKYDGISKVLKPDNNFEIEKGEVDAMKYLFNKYGKPRSQ